MSEKELNKITFTSLLARWKGETPIFWKKVNTLAITIGTSAVSVLGADKMFDLQAYGVPQLVFTIAGYVIVACATLGLAAKITKQDQNDSNIQ